MEIFIITVTLFDETENTGEAFFDEKEAAALVARRNEKATMYFDAKYNYEKVEVK